MRLHRLTLQGVGPFLSEQTIDFDALAASGLFLIDGPTGSGKTTLIDAIVFALYGELSGGSDVAASRVRSNVCGPDDPSVIELEFSVAGRRHVARRVPPGSRDPERPRSQSTTGSARLVERVPGGEDRVMTRVNEIRDHVETLLGMKHEQFTQLVVLPQGKFAELLRMRPSERQGALQPLLDSEGLFTRIQQDLQDRSRTAQAERRTALEAVRDAAARFSGQVAEQVAEQVGDGDGDGDGEPWADEDAGDHDRVASTRRLLREIADRLVTAEGERRDADTEQRAAAAALQAATTVEHAIGAAQEALARRADAQSALDPADRGLDEAGLAQQSRDVAQSLGGLEQHAEWEAAADERARAREVLARDAADARAETERVRSTREELPRVIASLEAELDAARAGEARLEAAAKERDAAASRLAARRALLTEQRTLETLHARATEAARATQEAANEVDRALQRYRELGDRQRAQRAAILAETLEPGEPCPVCGAQEHPAPAPAMPGMVTDAEVQAAGAEEAERRAEHARADETAGQAAAAARDHEDRVIALAAQAGELTEAAAEAQHDEAVGAVAQAEAAKQRAAEVAALLTAARTDQADLDEQLVALEHAAAQADALRDADEKAEASRAVQIAALVGDAGSAAVLVARLRDRLTRLKAAAEAEAAWLQASAAVPPDQHGLDLAEAQAQAAAARAADSAAQARHRDAVALSARLTSVIEQATPLADALERSILDRADAEQRTRGIIELAGLVNAGNDRRMTLASYALMRRFESVLASGSEHLRRMSGGRFTFEIDSVATQGHAGLGISVIDAWTGHPQEPKSLSGGETFYAALALALGLADVVRGEAGGSPLETLFIDEGFGSLDQDTLSNVLEQLDTLRAGNRVVGVISHVTEMKDTIHTGITVRRGDDRTSTIVQSAG